jgi:hypothetical protein
MTRRQGCVGAPDEHLLKSQRTYVKQTDAIEVFTSTRREFCARTCQALSLLTVGAVIQGCGGNSMSPSNAPALPSVAGSLVNGALTVTIGAASPLASAGGAALVQSSSGNFLVARTAQDVYGAHRRLHSRGLHRVGLRESDLRVPVPRSAVQHQRERSSGTGDVAAASVCDAIRQRRPDDQYLNVGAAAEQRLRAVPNCESIVCRPWTPC